MLLLVSVVSALLKTLALQGEGFLVSGVLREAAVVSGISSSRCRKRPPVPI